MYSASLRCAGSPGLMCFQNYQYMDRAIALLAEGCNSLKPMVTGEYALADWQAAFQAIEERRSIKNVLYI